MKIKLECIESEKLANGDTLAMLANPERTIEAQVTFHYPEIDNLIQPGHKIEGEWLEASTTID